MERSGAMIHLSAEAEAALMLFEAQKFVAGRIEGCWGSWWILDGLKWQIINSLPDAERDQRPAGARPGLRQPAVHRLAPPPVQGRSKASPP